MQKRTISGKRAPTAAEKVVTALKSCGVKRLFLVPGASLNPLMKALAHQTDIQVIHSATEGAAAKEALAAGMIDGLGVAVVSQGAGLVEGDDLVYLAHQNAAAALLLVGQAKTHKARQPEAFQSIDASLCAGYAKKVGSLASGGNTEKLVQDAIAAAFEGVPGAAVIEMPLDVLTEPDTNADSARVERTSVESPPADRQLLVEICQTINAPVNKPLVVLGDVFRAEVVQHATLPEQLDQLCSQTGLAVGTTHGAAGQWPTNHAASVGSFGYNLLPAQAAIFNEFDFPILLGAQPDDNLTIRGVGTSWTERPFAMIYPDRKVLARYQALYPHMIGVCSDIGRALDILGAFKYPSNFSERLAHVRSTHTRMLEGLRSQPAPDMPDLREAARAIATATKDSQIVHVFDAGDAAADVMQRLSYDGNNHLTTASGHVGFALPAGIGAALATQNRTNQPIVMVHTGDSGMHYSPSELMTAVANKLRLVVLVYNNACFGAINRTMLQMTDDAEAAQQAASLPRIDFGKVAAAYGADSIASSANAEALTTHITAALQLAKQGRPTVVDIRLDRPW